MLTHLPVGPGHPGPAGPHVDGGIAEAVGPVGRGRRDLGRRARAEPGSGPVADGPVDTRPASGRRPGAGRRRPARRGIRPRSRSAASEGRYEPGLEDRLDAHGRTMVAVRAGPGRRPPPVRHHRPAGPAAPAAGPSGGTDVPASVRPIPVPSRPLRILFVVQRYGEEVAGGAELCCRQFATRLAERGHHVEVATSRAQSAHDWADVYPPGSDQLDGVTVHRFGGHRRPATTRPSRP